MFPQAKFLSSKTKFFANIVSIKLSGPFGPVHFFRYLLIFRP